MKLSIYAFPDLSEHQTKDSPSNTHRNRSTLAKPEMCVSSSVEHLQSQENHEAENIDPPESKLEDILSPLMSLTSEEGDPSNEELHQDSLSTQDENEEENELDEDDNEEFEETLIELRPLNEVTSVTDRTSPWTTVLSDPELGSLESLEATEQPVDLVHEKERGTAGSPPATPSEPHTSATDSDLSARTEPCENAGRDADAEDVRKACVEYDDEEVFSEKDSTPDSMQMPADDQHDCRTDTEDDSPTPPSSRSNAKATSENGKEESKVKLYPFCRLDF